MRCSASLHDGSGSSVVSARDMETASALLGISCRLSRPPLSVTGSCHGRARACARTRCKGCKQWTEPPLARPPLHARTPQNTAMTGAEPLARIFVSSLPFFLFLAGARNMAAVVSAPGKVGGVGYCLAAAALLGLLPLPTLPARAGLQQIDARVRQRARAHCGRGKVIRTICGRARSRCSRVAGHGGRGLCCSRAPQPGPGGGSLGPRLLGGRPSSRPRAAHGRSNPGSS